MRAFFILILSCASLFGADTGIHVVTTCKTNESGSVTTKDIFTRDGQTNVVMETVSTVKTNADSGAIVVEEVFKRGGETNLVRKTVTKNGVVKQRMHYFYHDSVYVGFYYTGPIGSGFESQQNTPYRIGLDFDKLGKVQYVGIIETNGNQTEEFVYTNGLFLPDDGLLKE